MPRIPLSIRIVFVLAGLLLPLLSSQLAAAPDSDQSNARLEVRTSSLHLVFDSQGARPVTWEVIDPRYVSGGDGHGVPLIDPDTAGSHTLDVTPGDGAATNDFFRHADSRFERQDGADGIRLRFTSAPSPDGIVLSKTYFIPPSGFAIQLDLGWRNSSSRVVPLAPSIHLGPGLGFSPVGRGGLSDGMYAFVAPVYARGGAAETLKLEPGHPRVDFSGMPVAGIRWAGIHSRYFLLAIAPVDGTAITGGDADLKSGATALKPTITVTTGRSDLPAGVFGRQSFVVFGGPKVGKELQAGGADFNAVLFSRVWRWLRWLCFGLRDLLLWLHGLVPSWGVSLILLAALIRLATFPVAQFGLKEQARFNEAHARLRPELERIKLACKGDPQRQHQETTALYRAHGVSPFAAFKGCGWVLLQVPIFIALFNVIGQEYALRGAGFLWIHDLSQPDRLFPLGLNLPLLGGYFNILPLLMGATQVFVSNFSPSAGGDAKQASQQRRNMVLMAVAFTLLFYTFPAGLIIYWTAANLGHLIQQRLVARWTRRRAAPAAA